MGDGKGSKLRLSDLQALGTGKKYSVTLGLDQVMGGRIPMMQAPALDVSDFAWMLNSSFEFRDVGMEHG